MNNTNNKRKDGLFISLPSGALSEMEKKREEILLQRRQREQVVQVTHSYDDDDDDDDDEKRSLSDKYYSHEDEDEDDEIIPFQPIAQKGDDEFSDDDQQSLQTTEEKQKEKMEKQVDDNDDDDDDDDEESVLSLTAPETKPIIIVNFEKLCGFTPPNEEEAHILKTQIFAELLGKKTQKDNKANNEKENDNLGDGLSLEFVERSTSLFESGSAIHASIQNYNNDDDDKNKKKITVIDLLNEYDTDNHQTNLLNTEKTDNKDSNEILLRYCIIPYPEFIFYNNNNNKNNNKAENDSVISVEQAWKTLLKKSSPTSSSPSPPVIHKIMTLLKDTSRSLIWKYEMCSELSRIQKEEFHRKTKREQRKALKQWKQITRPNQLEQLYKVRETFELQKEKAYERLLDFQYERDVKVKEQMRLFYKQNKNNVMNNKGEHHQEDVDDVMLEMGDGKLIQTSANITSLDDDDDMFQYASSDQDDDDYLHQDVISQDDEDSEYHESFGESTDNDNDDNDDDSIDSFIKQNNTEAQSQTKDQSQVLIPTLPSTTHSKARLQRRKLKLKKKRKLQLFQQKQQQKQFLREQAKQHKIKLEEQNTSTQMKMAQMIHFTLSTKLNKIDELLESLQEEEWEDEEQKEIQELKKKIKMDTINDDENNYNTSSSDDEDDNDDEEFSLLDAILAMILGGLPRKASFTQQDHFQMIQQTHNDIIEEWKETFGKLPRNPTSSATGSAENKQKKKNNTKNTTIENDLSLQFQQNVTLNHNDMGKESLQAKRSALGIFDNDADDWDEFTDWDTLMPSFDITQIKEEEHTRDKELKVSTTKKEEETKKPQQQRVGLRPGGKIQ